MGAAGFTLESGLSDATPEEAQIKRLMVAMPRARSSRIVDHTKWERAAFATFCRTDDSTGVVTRRPGAGRRWSGSSATAASRSASSSATGDATAAERQTGPEAAPTDGPIARDRRRPPAVATATPRRVELRGVSKRFGATQALDDVSLDLRGGEVHALVGENGAGKSTLVKILAGIHQPDSGHDPARRRADRSSAARPTPATLGIAVVHQEPRLFPDLSVAENVFMGHAPTGPARDRRLGRDAARRPTRLFERARRPDRPEGARPRPLDGRPAADRDRQGAVARGARPDPRRADRVAVGARGRAAVHDRPPDCATAASPCCSSATGSTRSSSCATRRRSSATAGMSSRRRQPS